MLNLIYRHLAKNAPGYLWLLAIGVLAGRYLAVSINVSDSLSGKVYLIQKGVKPELGDLAAFRYQARVPMRLERGFSSESRASPGRT